MFGKLKEKLASFTKSLDKTVEEKAVELEEPEVIVEEEVVVETDGINTEEAAAAAEDVAELLEEMELEAIESTKNEDIEVTVEGTFEDKEYEGQTPAVPAAAPSDAVPQTAPASAAPQP